MSDITTGTWQLDPTHTEVGFTVRHLMSKVRGKFESFEGTLVTADDITASTVNVSVELASINTGTADRDNHLRSGDFFNVETNPTMTFASTGVVQKSDSDFVVTGDLTIKDITKPFELIVEFLGEGKDPWGNDYAYIAPGTRGDYDLYTLGADGQPGGEGPDADIGNWNIE